MAVPVPLLNGCRAFVGVAGWSYEDWQGVVYPDGIRNRLSFLASYVNCIEINSSFYRPLQPSYTSRWARATPDNSVFQFTAKLWQRFTHQWQDGYGEGEVRAFKEGLKPLQEAGKLGALLLQFPFYFKKTDATVELLRRLADEFSEFPRAIEVRDISWDSPESFDFFRSLGLNVTNIDLPMTKKTFRSPVATSGTIGYLRLHGRNVSAWFSKEATRDERYDHLYSDKDMQAIEERARRIASVSSVLFVIFNNHFRGKAVVNSLEMLFRFLREPLEVPGDLINIYPELDGITKKAGGNLFDGRKSRSS